MGLSRGQIIDPEVQKPLARRRFVGEDMRTCVSAGERIWGLSFLSRVFSDTVGLRRLMKGRNNHGKKWQKLLNGVI